MAEKTFTVEELKQFDGQDGHKAYVAVEGVVYDVTGVEAGKQANIMQLSGPRPH